MKFQLIPNRPGWWWRISPDEKNIKPVLVDEHARIGLYFYPFNDNYYKIIPISCCDEPEDLARWQGICLFDFNDTKMKTINKKMNIEGLLEYNNDGTDSKLKIKGLTKMQTQKRYHVGRNEDRQWTVKLEGGARLRQSFDNQREAVKKAKTMGAVVLHGSDGRFRTVR